MVTWSLILPFFNNAAKNERTRHIRKLHSIETEANKFLLINICVFTSYRKEQRGCMKIAAKISSFHFSSLQLNSRSSFHFSFAFFLIPKRIIYSILLSCISIALNSFATNEVNYDSDDRKHCIFAFHVEVEIPQSNRIKNG